MKKICLMAMVSSIMLTGCATRIPLDGTGKYNKNNIEVKDSRAEESKEGKRESIFSAIAFIAEKDMDPKPLDVFIEKLSGVFGESKRLNIDVKSLLVVDYFPVRLETATSGTSSVVKKLLADPIGEQDDMYIRKMGANVNQDSIICIFEGGINGKKVFSIVSEPYKISPFSALVRNQPEFKASVSMCINKLAIETHDRFDSNI